MHYEWLKHTGEYPIIGVNTFLGKDGSPTVLPERLFVPLRKKSRHRLNHFTTSRRRMKENLKRLLRKLQHAAINQQNLFGVMMDAVKYCSLGQITNALFEVGGKYRRNM